MSLKSAPKKSATSRRSVALGASIKPEVKSSCVEDCSCGCQSSPFAKKIILTLVGLLLVYVIFYLGTLINNNIIKSYHIGKADKMERTITISGFGKVVGQNNIAVTTIGYSNTEKEVAEAQLNNKKVMDQVLKELVELEIEDKDLQTNYSIYPDYNYTEHGQELRGYRVSHSVTVKIRDLSKINNVLSLAGKYGANEIGGLSFTIDDPTNLKDEARDLALEDAVKKAKHLANSLGAILGDVVSFNEYESGGQYYAAYDQGFGAINESFSLRMMDSAPEVVVAGSRDVSMNVNVTFELKN